MQTSRITERQWPALLAGICAEESHDMHAEQSSDDTNFVAYSVASIDASHEGKMDTCGRLD